MTVEYNFEAIPDEFKQHNNWLLWKYETRDGRKTKVPYQVSGARADSTAPNTWTSFDEAETVYMCGGFDGIGFAIGGSGLTCIDVDHLSEWDWKPALEPIENDCYVELSPSGDGLHIWVKAQKPNKKCRSKNFHNSMIEIYNSDRFITMTGADGDGEIKHCQDNFEIAFKDLFFPKTEKPKAQTEQRANVSLSLDDEQVISMICNEQSQGRNDWITWHSFGLPDGADASAIDQGYVNKVAFYTKDSAQIERIWLSSALGQRDKTQNRKDYRARTIDKAIQDVGSYQGGGSHGIEASKGMTSDQTCGNESVYIDDDLITICQKSPIAQFSDELAKSAKMPRNTTFLTVLAIFSAVTTRNTRVKYQAGGTQPLCLNFCGEQPPGASKSFVLSKAQLPVLGLVQDQRKALLKQIQEKSEQFEKLEDDAKAKKLIQKEIRDLKGELNALFEFITDTTPEALDMTLQQSNGYYSIASAEQGAINSLLGMSYTDAKSVANRDLALKGYNGEWHSSKRKGRETYSGFVVGSICALAQDGMIDNLLKASDSSGVFERFFVWSEQTLLGYRDHTSYHKIDEFIENEYSEALIAQYERINGTEYSELLELSLSNRAWDKIRLKRNEYEPTIADNGENSATILRGVIAKYDIFVMKLAGNLHLSIDADSTLIHDDRINEAMAITDAYIKHLKALIAESAIDALSERERAIVDFIGASKRTGKSVTDRLYRKKCFVENGNASRQRVADTLKGLVERNLIAVHKSLSNPNSVNNATFERL